MEFDKTQDSSYTESQDLQATDISSEKDTSSVNNNSKLLPENDLNQQNKEEVQLQGFYDEILDKLDIVKKQNPQDNQDKTKQENLKLDSFINKVKDLEKNKSQNLLEKSLKQDFDKIQKLVKNGLINSKQGQNLKKEVLKKAFDKLVQTEKIKRNQANKNQINYKNTAMDTNKNIEEFSQNNPNFFDSQGRKEVLNYLKSGNVSLGKDDINKISDIVRIIEKSAIDRFIQKAAHEKNLRTSNESAKQKLRANAQKTGFSGHFSRTFTREQIGNMSSEEFAKYEPAIMEALKRGLIK